MNKPLLIFIFLILGLGITWILNYTQFFNHQTLIPGNTIFTNAVTKQTPPNTFPASSPTSYKITKIASNLYIPWSIVFTSANRMLVTERSGAIRELTQISSGQWQLNPTPLITFPQVSTQSEEGLMGLAKDPNYENNFYLYACLAYPQGSQIIDKVIRFKDPASLSVPEPQPPQEILIDQIPAAKYHAGCEILFGPDGKLYITTGDATDKNIAQDLNSLGGKILRINPDGTIPADNPFVENPRIHEIKNYLYSYGHRNPQGLAFHPLTNQLWATEHGPSLFDGPAGGDEINLILPGSNYGWPLVSHQNKKSGTEYPKLLFTPAIAPASAIIYSGQLFPQWQHHLLFAALKGEGIIHASINQTEISSYQLLDLHDLNPGRIREIIEAPDGTIYFTTSNRDGRGTLRTQDDHIYQITPHSS